MLPNNHLPALSPHAKNLFALDEVWFMPNGNPPHKVSSNIGSDAKDRMAMVELAIAGKDYFELQPYEILNKDVNYSYKTMEHFREVYPGDEFYFIIGADSLFAMEKWVKPERLLVTCTMLAAYRDDKSTEEMIAQIQYLNEKYGADIRLLNTPNVDISSSEIRSKLQDKEAISELVPDAVLDYIIENQLYKED